MQTRQVPDGGWGWAVVIGVAITNMFNQSLISVFGLVYGEKIESLGHGTSGAALVMNISCVVSNFSGMLTGPLLKNFSCRKVCIAGGMLTSIGMILSSFAASLTQLTIFYSVLVGLGLGLIMPSSFVAVNNYFSTKRSRAVGFAMAGTGIGQMLMPQLVGFLLDEYGYQGATLILGSLCLNGVAGALLFQPVKRHMKKLPEAESKQLLKKDGNVEVGEQKLEKEVIKPEVEKIQIESKKDAKKKNIFQKIYDAMDLNLLRDPIFIDIIVGIAMAYTASVFFGMLFPFFLRESIGLTRSQTATCMSMLSGADILARLTLPTICQKLRVDSRHTFLFGAVALGASRSIIAEMTSQEAVMAVAVFCGYARASIVVNQNLTVAEYCSDEQLPAALGLNMVLRGIMVFSVGQLLGWIRDYTKSYTLSIHAQSTVLFLVAIAWSIEIYVIRPCISRHKK